jgi:hypothetical protein
MGNTHAIAIRQTPVAATSAQAALTTERGDSGWPSIVGTPTDPAVGGTVPSIESARVLGHRSVLALSEQAEYEARGSGRVCVDPSVLKRFGWAWPSVLARRSVSR